MKLETYLWLKFWVPIIFWGVILLAVIIHAVYKHFTKPKRRS